MRGIAPAQILGGKISVCHAVGGMFAALRHDHHVERTELSGATRCLEPEVCGISGLVIPRVGFGHFLGACRPPVSAGNLQAGACHASLH
jgi:hypothetical protein